MEEDGSVERLVSYEAVISFVVLNATFAAMRS
jgi:hypothetical protein